eukprot:jgi/Orpsp1_1/1191932/evm.model.d7180000089475.1
MTTITDSDLNNNEIDTAGQLPYMAIISCMKNYLYQVYQCAQTSGIISDKTSKYYAITMSSNKANEVMKTSNRNCFSTTIGSLVTVDDHVELCVTKDDHVPLSGSNMYYAVKGAENDRSPFLLDDKNYLLIKATSKFIVHDYNTYFVNAYVKANTREVTNGFVEGTYMDKLYSCSNGYCTEQEDYKMETNVYIYNTGTTNFQGTMYSFYNNKKGNVIIEKSLDSGIMAFVFTGNAGVKVKEDDFKSKTYFTSDTLASTYLIYCQNGQCLTTSGYLKYLTQSGTYAVNICTTFSGCTTTVKTTSCTSSEVAYYDSSLSKFILCIKDKTANKYQSIDIMNYQSNFILDNVYTNSQNYYLFESNINGDIVGYSKAVGNINTDLDGDGVKDFLGCYRESSDSFTECKKESTYNGYYIDIESKYANGLIYCSGNSCDNIYENNGYFTNYNRELIKCSEGVCLYIRYTAGVCLLNGDVIKSYDINYYCNNGKPEMFPETEKYYVVSNVDVKYAYPEIEAGTDTIILKATTYSITQITTDENGLCYDTSKKAIISDSECTTTGLTHLYCSSICKTCTKEKEKKIKYDPYKEQPTT